MTINTTIEEAKKALLKEAKATRKQFNINNDNLKVSCNVKQIAHGEFTIYSRDIDQYKETIMAVGSQFGTFVEIEGGGPLGSRMRFKFNVTEAQKEATGAPEEPITAQAPATPTEPQGKDTVAQGEPQEESQPQIYKKMSQKLHDALNEARVNMRVCYDLGPQVVQFAYHKCHNEQFAVILHNTDQRHGLTMLEAFRHLGQIVEVNKYDTCVEYIFRTHDAPYQRPAIVMDLRGLPCPGDLKEAKEEAPEAMGEATAGEVIKPLAEAKKDILKFADKLRKKHGIPGSDFRIICTDIHISIGEFILFTKGDQNNEHLRTEFDQFGRCYKIESAGKDATRFRFYYKGTSMYAN